MRQLATEAHTKHLPPLILAFLLSTYHKKTHTLNILNIIHAIFIPELVNKLL